MDFEKVEKNGKDAQIAEEIQLKTEELVGLMRKQYDLSLVPERQTQHSEVAEQLYQELSIMISNERFRKGFVDNFIRLNSRFPRSYFTHNPHNLETYTSNDEEQDSVLYYPAIT